MSKQNYDNYIRYDFSQGKLCCYYVCNFTQLIVCRTVYCSHLLFVFTKSLKTSVIKVFYDTQVWNNIRCTCYNRKSLNSLRKTSNRSVFPFHTWQHTSYLVKTKSSFLKNSIAMKNMLMFMMFSVRYIEIRYVTSFQS